MRSRSVIQHVLNELEARNADGIKRLVIGAAGISHRDRADAQVAKWCNPLLENLSDRRILLQVDPADFSRAVVDVEVSRNLRLLRLDDNRSSRLAQKIRQLHLIGSLRQRHVPEMLFYIAVRTKLS